MIKRGRHPAIVNNAAASALGRMIIRLGHHSGVKVINIVRRQEQADLLRGLGAEFVLDSSDDRFAPSLRDLTRRLRATIAFDAVGGNQTHTIVQAVPPGSTVVVYAGLAGEPSVFNPRTLAGEDKRIVGFYLANWMTRRGLVRMLRDIWRVQRLVAVDLQTTIRGRFPLSAAQTALDSYRSNMTAGKVLLVADSEQVSIADEARVA